MVNARKWIAEKLVTPAQALSPVQIGLAVAIGLWGGIFPIPGLSTFATLAFCTIILRGMFNGAMTSLAVGVNVIVTPFQVALLPVFLQLPSQIYASASCSVTDLLESIHTNPILETCSTFGVCLLKGVIAWLILAAPAVLVVRVCVASLVRTAKRD